MTTLTESTVEAAALEWLETVGWQVAHGPDIAPDTPGAERADYGQVVLEGRLRQALGRLNPSLPDSALEDALRRLSHPEGATLEARNRSFHRMLVNGVNVEYRSGDGAIRGEQARVIDFDNQAANDWLAVNQFTVTENQNHRRPDVVLFVNGLPLSIIELKNPVDEEADVWTAWQQLQTYKAELPTLFSMNEALIVSDGLAARIGTLTAGKEWFKPWRTISGETLAGGGLAELQVLLEGACEPGRFLSWSETLSCSMTTVVGTWLRRWLATTSSTPFGQPSARPFGRRSCSGKKDALAKRAAAMSQGAGRAATPATADGGGLAHPGSGKA